MTGRIVKSAERTLLVFEFFAIFRRPATASQIEAALELPQSSTAMLLHTLTELGYLEYSPVGRVYHPSMRVAIFGDWLKPALSANLWTKRLDELREKTHETVAVGRRQRDHVHYVQIMLASQPIQFYMREGTKRPLCVSASGRALLSQLGDHLVLRIARRYNDDIKAKALQIDEGHLLGCVREIRRTGISESDPLLGGERDTHAIATLIPREIEPEQLSLCVVGPKERILKRRDELIDTLKEWMAK